MKKLLLAILLVVFLVVISTGWYDNLVGMAVKEKIVYKCTDNDAHSTQPLNTQGYVTVTTSRGGRNTYSDSCQDEKTIREYSCNGNNKQEYHNYLCPDDQTCSNGRCK